MSHTPATDNFRTARDQLVALRDDYDGAVREFLWPDVGDTFNWGIDWFDAIARGNGLPALVIAEENGSTARFTFDEMATRSDQVGRWLQSLAAVPRTSTYALTNVTLKYATLIANLGWRDAVLKDQMLYKGVNLANGKCVYKPVADDLGIGYEPLRP